MKCSVTLRIKVRHHGVEPRCGRQSGGINGEDREVKNISE